MLAKSIRCLSLSLVCAFFSGLALTARTDAGEQYFKERFPAPVIAHLYVASPWKLISDLDDSVTIATRGVRQANYPTGSIKMFSSVLSPLPFGAWKEEEEAHILFTVIDGELCGVAIVTADSIDDFSDMIDGEFTEDPFGNKVFIGGVKSSRHELIIADLGKGKFLVTDNGEAYDALRPCLDDWFPSSPVRSGSLLRVDFQRLMRDYDELVQAALTSLKEEFFEQPDLWERLEDQMDEETDPDKLAKLEKFASFLSGWKNTGVLLEATVYAVFTMIDTLGMGIDFADGQLEMSFAVSGVKNSVLEEKIATLQAMPPLPLLFADKVPEDSRAYIAATNKVNFDKEIIAFARQIAYELFEEAAPDIPEMFDMLASAYLRAGLREAVSFAHDLPDGDDIESTYSTWDNPDEVLPLLEKTCTAFVRLQDIFIGFLDADDFTRNMDEEDEDDIAWLDNIKSDGFLTPIRPDVEYGEYAPTGDRYAHLTLRCDFEQFIPPSLRDDDDADFIYEIADELEDFQLVAMRKDDMVQFSAGLLTQVSPSDIFDAIFSVWNGETPNFAESETSIDQTKPRQQALVVLRILDLIVNEFYYYLPLRREHDMTEEAIDELMEKLLSLDNDDALMHFYNGAEGGGYVQTLVLPAKTVNTGMKNYFLMEREYKRR